LINKPIDSITKPDVDALIADQVAERRTLEFKRLLPGGTDDDKREFLADISSFANSSGGDLLFGVDAVDGVPKGARGLANTNQDEEKLRLESMIRDGLKPRVPPVHLHFIPGFSDGPVLLIRIPRSTASPHMVVFKNWSRFFARSSAGKWQLDVDELRATFAAGLDLAERIRNWRRTRVAVIASDQGPADLVAGARFVVHITPVRAFREAVDLGVEAIEHHWQHFSPLGHWGADRRYNIDGFVTTAGGEDKRPGTRGYCQVFRDGRVEAVLGDIARPWDGITGIPSVWLEDKVLERSKSVLEGLTKLGVGPPIVFAATMIGVRGAKLLVSGSAFAMQDVRSIDRDVVELPEVTLEDAITPIDVVLRPLFDALWNSSGLARSWSYSADGRWKPKL